jgi:isopenicillin N synthase-like dioxygenase
VSDHGVPAEVIARAEEQARAFFALPEAVKRRYHQPGTGGARGLTPFGIETAKGAKAHDLKEFYHVGRELPAGHRFAEFMAPNLWPDEVAEFRAAELALFDALDAAGARLLRAIARYLSLAPDSFDDTVRDGNSVLRLLHYPPMGPDGPSIRAGAHEDINTITLLLGAEEAGLQLLDRDGNWLPVQPRQGELAVNVGDMLQRLTNNVLRSTTHRVMNPAPERRGFSRYSMPFFLHFRPDYLIETLPQCVTPERPDLYPEPITAHDYLLERLREIRLI